MPRGRKAAAPHVRAAVEAEQQRAAQANIGDQEGQSDEGSPEPTAQQRAAELEAKLQAQRELQGAHAGAENASISADDAGSVQPESDNSSGQAAEPADNSPEQSETDQGQEVVADPAETEGRIRRRRRR